MACAQKKAEGIVNIIMARNFVHRSCCYTYCLEKRVNTLSPPGTLSRCHLQEALPLSVPLPVCIGPVHVVATEMRLSR
jgi:hypothetical protein